MMTVSSPAGRRLAKARAAFLEIDAKSIPSSVEYGKKCEELEAAADAVADELIASGFHLMDGDD